MAKSWDGYIGIPVHLVDSFSFVPAVGCAAQSVAIRRRRASGRGPWGSVPGSGRRAGAGCGCGGAVEGPRHRSWRWPRDRRYLGEGDGQLSGTPYTVVLFLYVFICVHTANVLGLVWFSLMMFNAKEYP